METEKKSGRPAMEKQLDSPGTYLKKAKSKLRRPQEKVLGMYENTRKKEEDKLR